MAQQKTKLYEPWHTYRQDDILKRLNTSQQGLTKEEIIQKQKEFGENKLPEGKKTTLLQIILRQLLNPLIFILIAAAIVSIAIGEGKDAVFIFIVIFINCALGSYQEYNAEKSASSLQQMMRIKARVRRDGKEQEVPSEELVPGDVVLLESGMKVPADMRLFDVTGLEIDESFLTGESIAAQKQTNILEESVGVAEMTNMAFAGATVLKGRGMGVVVSIGADTQVGKISQDVQSSDSAKPPLMHRMEKFIKQITIFIVVISLIMAILLRLQGMDMTAIFFFVVALAVSAIPEGLPIALTVALSIASKRMAKRNVIVRKLTSVESLGSCTVIASDKTGTLTVNEQTAKFIKLPNDQEYTIEGEGYNGEGKVTDRQGNTIGLNANKELDELAKVSVYANEASLIKEQDGTWSQHGDAMDVALLGMAYKLGHNPHEWLAQDKPIDIIPYESEKKYSAAFYHGQDGKVMVGVKGAVETILDFCKEMTVDGNRQPINKEEILADSEKMAQDGYRVLAFASGEVPAFQDKETYGDEDIPALTFHALVGFIDPLRPEAKASVEECRAAGIKVLMITGDHPETAGKIARDLGIADANTTVVTGKMLADAGDPKGTAFEKLTLSSTVFARVTPTQKLELVDVLIRNDEFVAVTGDGVNDAPALKRANIGVAMGSGTDVAKEVGAMIVVDDNFSSIVSGVEEGRFAYDNVRKVIYLLLSTGAAEIFIFLAAIFFGLPLPLIAVQLLWLNLVTNGIQDVSLAFEGGEPGAMKRRPRKPSESIFDKLMISQSLVAGITMGLITFGLWYYLIDHVQMQETHARDLVLLLMVFMQNFQVFNCRSERTSVFKIPLKRNMVLVFGVLAAQLLHIVSMQIPFMQNILRIEPITVKEWVYVLGLAIPMIVVMEIFKWIRKKMHKEEAAMYAE